MQVQSVHFSGKQHSLHNTIIKKPNDANVTYLYHLLDDTNHDIVMTFEIIENIINNNPEVIENKILVLQSDNCREQYKSKYTFYRMNDCGRKYSITVAWFYKARSWKETSECYVIIWMQAATSPPNCFRRYVVSNNFAYG